jgi:hypothetical protein
MEYKRFNWKLAARYGNVKSDKWELIEFPAILPSGKPVWPEYWKLEELEGVKASLSITKMECTMDAKSNIRRRCIN